MGPSSRADFGCDVRGDIHCLALAVRELECGVAEPD
jgi:hypothetical protein